jgi:hypothetical protein
MICPHFQSPATAARPDRTAWGAVAVAVVRVGAASMNGPGPPIIGSNTPPMSSA